MVSRSTSRVTRSRLLMPTSVQPARQARRVSSRSWTSTRGSRPQSRASRSSSCRRSSLRMRDDEQDRGRAGVGRLPDLPAVDDEVLAQHRQVDRGRHGAQVVERAAEARGLGEHRDGVGAGRRVGARLGDRVELRGDVALARRASLDLGDHGELRAGRPGGPARPGQRVAQPAGLAGRRRTLETARDARRGDAPARAGDHLGEEPAGGGLLVGGRRAGAGEQGTAPVLTRSPGRAGGWSRRGRPAWRGRRRRRRPPARSPRPRRCCRRPRRCRAPRRR